MSKCVNSFLCFDVFNYIYSAWKLFFLFNGSEFLFFIFRIQHSICLINSLTFGQNASGPKHAYQKLQTHVQTAPEFYDFDKVFAV